MEEAVDIVTESPTKKEELTATLKSSIVRVDFTTTKGAECTKYATLQESILPVKVVVENDDANDALTAKKPRKDNPDVLNFWSVEDNAWRATRIENIKSITVLNEEAATRLIEEVTERLVDAAALKDAYESDG